MLAANMPSTSSRILYFAARRICPATTLRFSSKSTETKSVEETLSEASSATPVMAQSMASPTHINTSNKSLRCTNCSAQGHYSFECPLPSKYFIDEESGDDVSKISPEGITFVRPKEDVPAEADKKASIRCTNCSAFGHYSFECDQPEKCKYCQSTDHFHMHCPKNKTEQTDVGDFPPLSEQVIRKIQAFHTQSIEEFKEDMARKSLSLLKDCKREQKQEQPSWSSQSEELKPKYNCSVESPSVPPLQYNKKEVIPAKTYDQPTQKQKEEVTEHNYNGDSSKPSGLPSQNDSYKKSSQFGNQYAEPKINRERVPMQRNYDHGTQASFLTSQRGTYGFQLMNQHSEQRSAKEMYRSVQKNDQNSLKPKLKFFSRISNDKECSPLLYSHLQEDGTFRLCMSISKKTRNSLVGQNDRGLLDFEKKLDNNAKLNFLDIRTKEILFILTCQRKSFDKCIRGLLPILLEEQNGTRYSAEDPVHYTLDLLVHNNYIKLIMGVLKARGIPMRGIRFHNKQFPATCERVLVLELPEETLSVAVQIVVDAISSYTEFKGRIQSNDTGLTEEDEEDTTLQLSFPNTDVDLRKKIDEFLPLCCQLNNTTAEIVEETEENTIFLRGTRSNNNTTIILLKKNLKNTKPGAEYFAKGASK